MEVQVLLPTPRFIHVCPCASLPRLLLRVEVEGHIEVGDWAGEVLKAKGATARAVSNVTVR
jgi:hypothetical protein